MKKEQCLRCGHKWYRRTPEKPVLCPSCKSKYWDQKREKLDHG
jgi:predicted Zn-ribbon and HTH transcriptional regulator